MKWPEMKCWRSKASRDGGDASGIMKCSQSGYGKLKDDRERESLASATSIGAHCCSCVQPPQVSDIPRYVLYGNKCTKKVPTMQMFYFRPPKKVEVVADKDDATPENVEESLTMNILGSSRVDKGKEKS
ncbi:hypothetical protein Tco_0295229 [Tanacetum coccineum]